MAKSDWAIIAQNVSKAGFSWGCSSEMDLTGLATGFFSVLSTLKETSSREAFITSALVNSDGTSPLVIAEDFDFSNRLHNVGSLLTMWRHSNANKPFDQFNDLLAVEQYYVTRLF